MRRLNICIEKSANELADFYYVAHMANGTITRRNSRLSRWLPEESSVKQSPDFFVSSKTSVMDVRVSNVSKYLLLICSIVLFYSCSNTSDNIAAFKTLDEGLINSNNVIDKSSARIYRSLEEKLADPVTVEKAKIWFPKADSIRKVSHNLTNYIEVLKMNVGKGNALHTKEATDLYSRLVNYKIDLMQIDSGITAEFKSSLMPTNSSFDSSQNNQGTFAKTFFLNLSREATISLLSKLQNNIKVNENRLLSFCLSKIPSYEDTYDWLSVLVTQNTSYLKAGDKIEITAGVGSFTRRTQAEIIIGGKQIPTDVTGFATAKLKVSKEPGKHFIPVMVSYTDQDGKKETFTKPVEYTVLEN